MALDPLRSIAGMKTSTNTAQHPKKHLFAAIFKPKERSLTLSIDNLDVLGADTDDDENSSGSERMRSFSATNPPSPTLSASIPGHISPLSNSQKPATPQSPNRAPLESWDSGVWDTRWVPEVDLFFFFFAVDNSHQRCYT